MSLTNSSSFPDAALESNHNPDLFRPTLRGSPVNSPRRGPSLFGNGENDGFDWLRFFWGRRQQLKKGKRRGGSIWYLRKKLKGLVVLIGLVGVFFLVNWFMLMRLQEDRVEIHDASSKNSSLVSVQEKLKRPSKGKKQYSGIYGRMLALAAHALAEVVL